MLSTSLSLSSSLMHRVARNPAAGARGPAGGVVWGSFGDPFPHPHPPHTQQQQSQQQSQQGGAERRVLGFPEGPSAEPGAVSLSSQAADDMLRLLLLKRTETDY